MVVALKTPCHHIHSSVKIVAKALLAVRSWLATTPTGKSGLAEAIERRKGRGGGYAKPGGPCSVPRGSPLLETVPGKPVAHNLE